MILTDSLLDFFLETRKHTEHLCAPLEIEDYVVQPIVDVSPPKWHLGHTTWFFEEFIIKFLMKISPLSLIVTMKPWANVSCVLTAAIFPDPLFRKSMTIGIM